MKPVATPITTPAHEVRVAEGPVYVTASIAGQLVAFPIEQVHDVFHVTQITPVPLSPPQVLGLLNLRGRVLTAVDLRQCLGMPGAPSSGNPIAIGLEIGSEFFCAVVDGIGEVVQAPPGSLEPNPVHLDHSWARLSRGIHRLEDGLTVVVDVEAMLRFEGTDPSHERLGEH